MQEANVNDVKGYPMLSSHTTNKESNVTKERVSNRIIAYMYVTQIHGIHLVIIMFNIEK